MNNNQLTWLHLSDLHFGHGREARHRVDQQIVCAEILRDASAMTEQLGPPDLVFITGDIAFKADPLQEYPRAAAWIERLLTTVKVGKDRLYLVPGNHDVDRGKAVAGFTRRRLHESLRAKPTDLDELLAQPDELGQLWSKLQAYADFAKPYAAPLLTPSQPFWSCERDTALGKVIIVGLNTVLLSFDDGDAPKNLALGQGQLQRAIHTQSQDTLLLVLQHHPPAWLIDDKHLHAMLQDRSHVLFCGHVHQQGGLLSKPLHGGEGLELVAGAGHTDPSEPAEHAYAWGCLRATGLEYFPRTWNAKQYGFVADRNSFREMKPNAAISITRKRLPKALQNWLPRVESADNRPSPGKRPKPGPVQVASFPEISTLVQQLTGAIEEIYNNPGKRSLIDKPGILAYCIEKLTSARAWTESTNFRRNPKVNNALLESLRSELKKGMDLADWMDRAEDPSKLNHLASQLRECVLNILRSTQI